MLQQSGLPARVKTAEAAAACAALARGRRRPRASIAAGAAMDALVGGLGCDSAAGNPLGNLVDGFLDRTRVAEQMVRARLLELLRRDLPGAQRRAPRASAVPLD